MRISAGEIILIKGMYFVIEEIKEVNGNYHAVFSLLQRNIGGSKVLENSIINGANVEEAITKWFYKRKKITHSSYSCIAEPDISGGEDEIRKLLYINMRTPAEIIDALDFSMSDYFWKNQILSLNGLRKKNKDGVMKFDTLFSAMTIKREKKMESQKKTEKFTGKSRTYDDLD